jgi:hypothetical protein
MMSAMQSSRAAARCAAVSIAAVCILATGAQANPIPIHTDDSMAITDPDWPREVEGSGALFWDDEAFHSPFVFGFDADTLRVNGVVVELRPAYPWELRSSGSREHLKTYAEYNATTFDEWVAIYRDSDLVVGVDAEYPAIAVHWSGSVEGKCERVVFAPKLLDALHVRVWRFLDHVAHSLRSGHDVYVLNGVGHAGNIAFVLELGGRPLSQSN